jgi:hypothetical protein
MTPAEVDPQEATWRAAEAGALETVRMVRLIAQVTSLRLDVEKVERRIEALERRIDGLCELIAALEPRDRPGAPLAVEGFGGAAVAAAEGVRQ